MTSKRAIIPECDVDSVDWLAACHVPSVVAAVLVFLSVIVNCSAGYHAAVLGQVHRIEDYEHRLAS